MRDVAAEEAEAEKARAIVEAPRRSSGRIRTEH
jgi:hypothetical protein